MKAKYILVPANHVLAGKRRKVRCKCTDGASAIHFEKSHMFNTGSFAKCCPDCKVYYFYVEGNKAVKRVDK